MVEVKQIINGKCSMSNIENWPCQHSENGLCPNECKNLSEMTNKINSWSYPHIYIPIDDKQTMEQMKSLGYTKEWIRSLSSGSSVMLMINWEDVISSDAIKSYRNKIIKS